MNSGAVKAARADMRLANGVEKVKVPRHMKRTWRGLTAKERGKLRRQWRLSQLLRGVQGNNRHQSHLDALKAFVKPKDIRL